MTRRITLALGVLVLASAVLTGVLALQPSPEPQRPRLDKDGSYSAGTIPEDGAEVVEATAEALPLALSYDYRTLDDDLDEATGQMTEGFGKEFRTTFGKTAATLAREKSAITNTLVRGAGVVERDGDRAVCLAYIDQMLVTTKAAKTDKGPVEVSQNRVLVTLEQVDGDWKIDGIDPF